MRILCLALFLAGGTVASSFGQTQNLPIDRGFIGLSQALDRLPYVSRLMFIAAHPDDENSGVLPYVSRGLNAETALLTLTRGEGGQNLIGPELFDALGLIRTGELMAACEYYGVQQFFTRAYDFGFSETVQETLQKWNKDVILSDMVRAIRRFRPHVIISVWRGESSDGHGHHQASGLLAREAFHAAADPARFPELNEEGLAPWSVQKFYVRAKKDDKTVVTVDPGKYVPLLGSSYQEIASIGYSFHRSQGMGNSYSGPGSRTFSYRLVSPENTKDSGFFDNLETTLSDLPKRLPAADPLRTELERGIQRIDIAIAQARRQLLPTDFSGTIEALLQGLMKVRELHQLLVTRPSSKGHEEVIFFLSEKEDDFCKALELASGIHFEAVSIDPDVVPGQTFEISATVVNRSAETIDLQQTKLAGEPGWKFALKEGQRKSLQPGEKLTLKYTASVPAQASLSQPHWRRNSKQQSVYTVTETALINAPLISPKLLARVAYAMRGTVLELKRPVEYLDSDKLKGTRKISLMVVPKLAIEVSPSQHFISTSVDGHGRELQVRLVNNTPAQISGTLSVKASSEWTIEPPQATFTIGKEGEAATVKFRANVGRDLRSGRTGFEAVAILNGEKIDQSYRMYSVLDLWRLPLYKKAASEVVAFDYRLPGKLEVGYIMGAGDRVPDSLLQLGVPVRLLEADDLAAGDLQQYDCIIAGVRAYEVREDLVANNARLLEYVHRGGLLIVQYHRQNAWNKAQYAPYAAKIQDEDHRVTDEAAPVRILDPKHPVFHYPNKVTEKDFEDWVQERGLYFIQERDSRYKPLLSCNDPGRPPLDGGLLVADYGRGKYVLTCYAWFRQLPEGVPGAIRIFLNLLSLNGKATDRGR